MRNYLLMLLFSVSLIACDKGNDGPSNEITLTGGTQATQNLYADETSSSGSGITFNSPAAWTATVREVATRAVGDEANWLSLTSYEGNAGSNTLGLIIDVNYSGVNRAAEIVISSAGSKATIYVEQKATTQNNTVPKMKLVDKIEQSNILQSTSENYAETSTIRFSYDGQSRVSGMTISGVIGGEQYSASVAVTYGTGRITYATEYQNMNGSGTYTIVVPLNSLGYIQGMEEPTAGISTSFAYNNGYLSTYTGNEKRSYINGDLNGDGIVNEQDRIEFDIKNVYTTQWSNGNLTEITGVYSEKNKTNAQYVVKSNTSDSFTYSTHKNNLNIDLNWMLCGGITGSDAISAIGENMISTITPSIFGKRTLFCASKVVSTTTQTNGGSKSVNTQDFTYILSGGVITKVNVSGNRKIGSSLSIDATYTSETKIYYKN